MLRTLAFAALVSTVIVASACPAEPAPPPPATTVPPPSAPPATTPPPPPPPPEPEEPEPAGITAGGKQVPAAPKGKGTWAVDPAATTVSFTIVSNSAGPITGKFPGGAAGAFDAKKKQGVFTIDLTKMSSTNQKGEPNPLRDTNVVEAFFGARPFANAALKEKVDAAWQALGGKIKSGVGQAALVVDGVEGEAAKGKGGDGVVNGKLVLWESVEVPVSWPVSVTVDDKAGTMDIKGKAPAMFNITKVVGTPLRTALFNTMLAAGCAHQPGIKSDVSVTLDQVTLKKQ